MHHMFGRGSLRGERNADRRQAHSQRDEYGQQNAKTAHARTFPKRILQQECSQPAYV
jgi:hypothetical protein